MKTSLVILYLKMWKKLDCTYKTELLAKSEKKTEAIMKSLIIPLVRPVLYR